MTPREIVRFCPRCAAPAPSGREIPFRCPACSLTLFFNPTVAAAGFLFDSIGRVILLERAKEPQKGKWTIPGGFVDFGESIDAALRREVREEVGIEIENVQFLNSTPNRYEYAGITYGVCDIIFTAVALRPEHAKPLDGAASIRWALPGEIDPESLAFPSVREGLAKIAGVKS
jgi:ADP-ribose pyrophosphatase YjhB (NUDIX family)